MGLKYVPLFLYMSSTIVFCSLHIQEFETMEQAVNTLRVNQFYKTKKHNHAFDYAVLLGSRAAAKEFENMRPEEAKKRLRQLVAEIDVNKDGYVDKDELKNWILRSFKILAQEASIHQLKDEDDNDDGKVSWEEHTTKTHGILDNDTYVYDAVTYGRREDHKFVITVSLKKSQMYEDDMELFKAADLNGDGILEKKEFPAFSHPAEFEYMHEILYKQAMQKSDIDADGYLTFEEYFAGGYEETKYFTLEYLIMEVEQFHYNFDADRDEKLNKEEVMSWLIPNNVKTAETKVNHLIDSSDTDKDGKLSLDEIVLHYDVFVGSEATDLGEQLHNFHKFSDEL